MLTAITVTGPAGGDAGAVYRPVVLFMVPFAAPPTTLQVTAEFAAFVTTTLNCWVIPAVTVIGLGDTVTVMGGGVTVIVVEPMTLMFCTLTAVIVNIVAEVTTVKLGAVYRPLGDIEPTVLMFPPGLPFTCQVTAVLPVPVTMAANCCVAFVAMLGVAGDTLIAVIRPVMVSIEEADLVGSA